MIAVVVAALSWSNAGWADNPKPTPVRASWVDDPFERKPLPIALRPEPAKPEPTKPVVPKPAAVQPPQVHYLADRSGKTWYSSNPTWLRTYVDQVNAAMTARYAAPVYQPVYQYGSPCANGSCPR